MIRYKKTPVTKRGHKTKGKPMKHLNDADKIRFPQLKNDEVLNKLLESLRRACEAMIDTIDAYRMVMDRKDGRK